MTTELKVTPVSEYARLAEEAAAREPEDPGELVTLPETGAVVRLRRADLEELAYLRALPTSLTAATQAAQGQVATNGAAKKRQPTPEEIARGERNIRDVQSTVFKHCLEPRLGFDAEDYLCFVDAEGKASARVRKADYLYMYEWITGQEGADGLELFRNRAERRALASQSRRGKVRTRPVGTEDKGQSAAA